MTRRLVLATDNPGKLRELAALLGDRWDVLPQGHFGVRSAPETGTTFRANAELKARHAAAATGLPCIADDSGLEVDALAGAPGVESANYAGPAASDAANNDRLLAALAGVPQALRTARYRCVLVYVRSADDPHPLVAEGRWEGSIATAPRGHGGFGYDPLFIDAATGRTGAELGPAAKNAASHRGQALRALRQLLDDTGPGA
jgi:XTP/dITP diphosphohydrolase